MVQASARFSDLKSVHKGEGALSRVGATVMAAGNALTPVLDGLDDVESSFRRTGRPIN